MVTVTSNHEQMKKSRKEGINFPSEKDDWNKFEKNDVTIAINILHAEKKLKSWKTRDSFWWFQTEKNYDIILQ